MKIDTGRIPATLRKQLNVQSLLLLTAVCGIVALELPLPMSAWGMREGAGIGALVGFAVAYLVTADLLERDTLGVARGFWLSLQVACVLYAFERFQNYPVLELTVPALLAVIASQIAALVIEPVAIFVIVCTSAALWAVTLVHGAWPGEVIPAVLFLALQGCAVILTAATLRAEQARDELARTNAELVSMQSFVSETVRDRERLRIARDLHDVTGHKLTALKINLMILQQRGAEALREHIDRSTQIADQLLTDTRDIVRQLSDAEGLSLADALGKLASLLPDRMIAVDIEDDLRVQDGEVARLLLRAAQEGVSNALRHGGAARITLSLRRIGDRFMLRVVDNGRGLRGDPAGFGRSQLAERVHTLGGEYRLQNGAAGGAELEITLPERAPAA